MAVRQIHDEERTRREAEQRSVGSLVSELGSELSTLVRKEVELVKAEGSQKLSQARNGAMATGIGALVAFAGLLVLLQAAAFGLAEVMHLGWAALIVGGAALIIGGAVAMIGMSRLKPENLKPAHSAESLREDAELAKEKANGRQR
ncbi:hypothetical protein CAI21_04015 [Alkalilimnicola ehrlichii]|uniref:Phage holin family protein n=1 Tax=Alkalilimnicola ehrlichii TaxID=351052 RepID=A0A3E0X1G0_9GAMM|nr:phage holin family protein [Alkalilimnicola ehrlichii]RFA30690.1 hypothetical protein CAI21_04015 [Alkalilimnicola ehrlichii]RFA38269.1 hypothetical protein CAL65_05385 [Alkalilimnicola ehrlichii]